MEMASTRYDDVSSGYIAIAWLHNGTLWDYDHHAYSHIPQYQDSCFPIQKVAAHDCCPPSLALKLMKPIISALLTKRTRLRTVQHCVPKGEIFGSLSEYGILGHMLPTDMGGSVRLDQAEWMTDRRAVEKASELVDQNATTQNNDQESSHVDEVRSVLQ